VPFLQSASKAAGPYSVIVDVQRRVGRGVGELPEVGKGVVVVVAVLVVRAVGVVVDAPADAGVLQALGVGRPVAHRVLGDDRVVGEGAGRAVLARPRGAGPQVEPVGVGGAVQRGEVAVADGEGVGQGVLEGNVRTGEVPHGELALGGDPLVLGAVVDRLVARVPPVVEAAERLRLERAGVETERQRVPLGPLPVRLAEDRVPVREDDALLVVEAADTVEGAQVVVEAAVLLHEDDDVLDVGDAAVAARRRLGGGRQAEGGRCAGGRGGADEGAAAERGHVCGSFAIVRVSVRRGDGR
jgi:hypothetical protein